MPLPLPNLDDRRWVDLVDEGLATIPRESSSWTDHNVHDPGITFMELFAWLSESHIYQLNRIPVRHLKKFLSLLGIDSMLPIPSQTVLAVSPPNGIDPIVLSRGTEFETTPGGNGPIAYQTLRDLTLSHATLHELHVALPTIQADDSLSSTFKSFTQEWHDQIPIALFGLDPQPEAACYFGFHNVPPGEPVTLAFTFKGPGTNYEERLRLIEEADAQRLACQSVLPDIHCEEENLDGLPSTVLENSLLVPSHHSVQVRWEVSVGDNEWSVLEPVVGGSRPAPGQIFDDTRSLTLDGIVEVNFPPEAVSMTVEDGTESLVYLRGRLLLGEYDAPPYLHDLVLHGVLAEQNISVSHTFPIAPLVNPSGPTPTSPDFGRSFRFDVEIDEAGVIQELAFLEPGLELGHPEFTVWDFLHPVLNVPGRLTLDGELLGKGNGWPEQSFRLRHAPLTLDHLQVFTHANGEWQTWSLRKDFDSSLRTDFHFVVDAMTGEISFGSGERGRVVPLGVIIFCQYRYTRGTEGNVDVQSSFHLRDSARNQVLSSEILSDPALDHLEGLTTNQQNFIQGSDEEPLHERIGRAVNRLHAHQRLMDTCQELGCQSLDEISSDTTRTLPVPTRAINLFDFERLALDVPGTRIARVRALANVDPLFSCLTVSGTITIIVVPDSPIPQPIPSVGLLKVIARYLDSRRLVTTRLKVVAPTYLPVSVIATVKRKPHITSEGLHIRIQEALNGFLNSHHGGPSMLGWPFGRNVYRNEIFQILDEVPGVDHVLDLLLAAPGLEPQCGNISLCPTWLASSGEHRIEIT